MQTKRTSLNDAIRPEDLGSVLRRYAGDPSVDNAYCTARVCLSSGFWPVVISPHHYTRISNPGKSPVGKNWGVLRPTVASLMQAYDTHRRAGVGLKLGAEGRLVDVDVDHPDLALPVLARLFPGGPPDTLGWSNAGGKFHLLFLWDDRLAAFGKTVIKGSPDYPGLELRLGAPPGDPRQVQTVVPPSPLAGGTPRRWNDAARVLPLPESVFADLESRVVKGPEGAPPLRVGGDGQWGVGVGAARHRPATGESASRPASRKVLRRAVAYLRICGPAVEGRNGSGQTFKVACKLGPGFDLPAQTAFDLMWTHYNPTCLPPWTAEELWHKVEDAYRIEPRRGFLL